MGVAGALGCAAKSLQVADAIWERMRFTLFPDLRHIHVQRTSYRHQPSSSLGQICTSPSKLSGGLQNAYLLMQHPAQVSLVSLPRH